jgi:hypothetical protein
MKSAIQGYVIALPGSVHAGLLYAFGESLAECVTAENATTIGVRLLAWASLGDEYGFRNDVAEAVAQEPAGLTVDADYEPFEPESAPEDPVTAACVLKHELRLLKLRIRDACRLLQYGIQYNVRGRRVYAYAIPNTHDSNDVLDAYARVFNSELLHIHRARHLHLDGCAGYGCTKKTFQGNEVYACAIVDTEHGAQIIQHGYEH